MEERELRSMIEAVRSGRIGRRHFVQAMIGLGLTAPLADPDAGVGWRRPGPAQGNRVQAHQAGRRRRAEDPVVAGRDPAQPSLRHRHQGPGRLAHLLRAARVVGSRREPRPDPGRRHPDRAERRRRQGRQVGDVAPQEGRGLARRQALHGRRLRVHLGVRRRPRHRLGQHRHLQGRQGREDRQPHDPGGLREADAVLGRSVRRRARDGHPEAPLRGLQGRQVPRGADQPQAGRHRAPTSSSTSSRATSSGASSTRTTTCPTVRSSTPSR